MAGRARRGRELDSLPAGRTRSQQIVVTVTGP